MKLIALLATAAVAFMGAAAPSFAQDIPAAEANFLRKSAAAGHAEAMASELAQSKAASKEVKAFADQMLEDHEKNAEALERLAASKAVTLPRNPTKEQLAELEALKALDGAAFDQRYAERFGVQAHEDMLSLLQAGTQAKDEHVKDYAEKTRPTVEKHLKMGKTLKAALDKRLAGGPAAKP